MSKDFWINENLPQEEKFDRGFVKYLMKLAYEEGQRQNQRDKKEQEREDRHGPMFL